MKTTLQYGLLLTTALANCQFCSLTQTTTIFSRHMYAGSCKGLPHIWDGIHGPMRVSMMAWEVDAVVVVVVVRAKEWGRDLASLSPEAYDTNI